MTDIHHPATSRTPAVTLNKETAHLLIEGESYPEDVTGFYAPIFQSLEAFFSAGNQRMNIDIKLIYFNSSSARALTELLDIMDSHAAKGASITIRWFCDHDDDVTREFAEDVAMEMENLTIAVIDLNHDG